MGWLMPPVRSAQGTWGSGGAGGDPIDFRHDSPCSAQGSCRSWKGSRSPKKLFRSDGKLPRRAGNLSQSCGNRSRSRGKLSRCSGNLRPSDWTLHRSEWNLVSLSAARAIPIRGRMPAAAADSLDVPGNLWQNHPAPPTWSPHAACSNGLFLLEDTLFGAGAKASGGPRFERYRVRVLRHAYSS